MELNLSQILMLTGFSLAAYSIVANDAIQTLGTFLSSNSHRPWWILWIYTMTILSVTLIYGWYMNGGDVSYGRLTKFPEPAEFSWIYVLPPIFILLLTRFGIPVSTTFLVLTVFTATNLEKMLIKSLSGYLVAFFVGMLVYRFVVAALEKHFIRTSEEHQPSIYWVIAQWCSTGFLWCMWLTQDLANIYVYAPTHDINADGVRTISSSWLIGSLLWLYTLHAYIFYRRGGAIQKIVTSKTNTQDIRSASIVDFIYAIILFVFKEMSNIPMSTTWVFLGLLAGREFAIAWITQLRNTNDVLKLAGGDVGKAAIGLLISVILAFSAPVLKEAFSGQAEQAKATDKQTAIPHLALTAER